MDLILKQKASVKDNFNILYFISGGCYNEKEQFLALALSAVMAGGMLAGCGSSNGSSSSSKSDAKDEVVTLKWIQVGNGMPKDYDEWLAQINPYLEEKIGVNVDMEIVPWGGLG